MMLVLSAAVAPLAFAQDVRPSSPATSMASLPTEPRPDLRLKNPYKIEKNRKYFSAVTDYTFPDDPIKLSEYNDAWYDILTHAHQFPAKDLVAHAITVPYVALFQDEREAYRYDLVKFDGILMRLIKDKVPGALSERGIENLYQAWIFTGKQDHPICVDLTELPEGLEPAERYSPAPAVTVAGYYFRLHRYSSMEKDPKGNRVSRNAPQLLTHSLVVTARYGAGSTTDNWSNGFLPAVIIGILLLSALVLGMTWWFRSSDRRSKRILKEKQGNPFPVTEGPPLMAGPEIERPEISVPPGSLSTHDEPHEPVVANSDDTTEEPWNYPSQPQKSNTN